MKDKDYEVFVRELTVENINAYEELFAEKLDEIKSILGDFEVDEELIEDFSEDFSMDREVAEDILKMYLWLGTEDCRRMLRSFFAFLRAVKEKEDDDEEI